MIRTRWAVTVAVALAAALPLRAPAQVRPRRAALIAQIEQLYLGNLTRQMGLTAGQLPRFRAVITSWAQKRAALEAEEAGLRQALMGELRPGIAADADSVAKLVDALNANQVAYAESLRDEVRDLTPILTPVQRGQFELARDRLMQRVRDIQNQRANAAPPAPGSNPP